MAVLKYLDPITKTYKVLNTNTPEPVEAELIFDTYDDFPAVGEVGKLYIAVDLDKTFRWDSDKSKYFAVGDGTAEGLDWSEIG